MGLEEALAKIESGKIEEAEDEIVGALVELKIVYAQEFPSKYSRETW